MKEIFEQIGDKKKAKQLLKDLKKKDMREKIKKILEGLEDDEGTDVPTQESEQQ